MGHLQLVKVSFVTLVRFVFVSKPNEYCVSKCSYVEGLAPYTTNTVPTTCSDLTVPTNGMIGYNMATSPRPVNTVATYTCVTGYTLQTYGGNTTRTCGSDGVWSGSAVACYRKWNGLL